MSTTAKRLWPRVDKRDDGCWIFTGSKQKTGYGQLWAVELGGVATAHRAAWLLTHGPIPSGMYVCHTCDVRACCNPDHLFLGTPTDNNRDRRDKGRGHRPTWRGESCPSSRFTDAQIAEMRSRRAAGEKLRTIAEHFGCSESHVSAVYKHKTRT